MSDRYRKRLTLDLDRWIKAGLVPAASREGILDDIAPAPSRWSAQGAAAILGAVLLALAAISFVAANWADLSRAIRFGIILIALWGSFGGAIIAFRRQNAVMGHALALLGAALFGGAIALTAQTFNMSAFRNTGIMIWALGALVTAIAIPSRPVLSLSALIGGLWLYLETFNPLAPPILWAYPLLFLVSAAAASRLRSGVAMNLLAAGLGLWLGRALVQMADLHAMDALTVVSCFTLISAALGLAAAQLRARGVDGAGIVAAWSAAGAAAGLFTLQPALDDGGASIGALYPMLAGPALLIALGLIALQRFTARLPVAAALALAATGVVTFALPYAVLGAGDQAGPVIEVILGAGVFAAAAALIVLGAAPERRTSGIIGVIVFISQATYVYAELFGGLLGTAAFFFVGGVLMIALSVLLTRIARTLSQRSPS
jgi:uncharacterized membrane protein